VGLYHRKAGLTSSLTSAPATSALTLKYDVDGQGLVRIVMSESVSKINPVRIFPETPVFDTPIFCPRFTHAKRSHRR
jgi:hypothetical protein